MYARGLKPILPGRLYPKLSRYFHPAPAIQLPTPPDTFAHGSAIPDDGWGMDGNDEAGDCFWAAIEHEDKAVRSDNSLPYTPLNALDLYARGTGYDGIPGDDTDQGTDPIQGFSWMVKQGIILAWAAVNRSDLILPSLWAFGGHILGCAMPDDSDAQFEAGGPFDIKPGSRVPSYEDHAIYQPRPGRLVTWGRELDFTDAWGRECIRHRFVIVLPDMVKTDTGLTECGLALDALTADCNALARMV